MSGIYIHIPFCKKACHYCNFHFSTSLRNKDAMLNALKKELLLRRDYLNNEKIKTIYFGGGTPSMLDIQDLNDLLDIIYKNFQVDSDAEITLEANPDDLSQKKLYELKNETSVNRLSIGIQSFNEADLKYMNRAHDAKEAIKCLENARKIGFDNVSADLIYGTPSLSDEQWMENIKTIADFEIPHLSCYALTVEPKTALQHLIISGKTENIDEEQTARQFEILLEKSALYGYEQYEISNFCRPGFYSRHNTSYWNGITYLGIGPSAHSFNGNSRQWNIANNSKYIAAIEKEDLPFEIEILNKKDVYNEYLLTALRTKNGIDINHVKLNFGEDLAQQLLSKIDSYLRRELLIQEKDKYLLSDQGKLLADSIISDLFIV
jgi:oxygen-independent coproporphyrinogen-3 oxidase